MAGRGVNKVILIGNLGNDPDTRSMPSGDPVTNFSVATSESWKDKNTGERQERTEWHRIVMFGRLAEIAKQYLRKGSKVYLEGKLRTRKWQGQDGLDRYTTEVVVDINGSMQMLDSRPSDYPGAWQDENQSSPQPDSSPFASTSAASAASAGAVVASHSAPQQAPPAQSAPPAQPQEHGNAPQDFNEPFDDDIPF